MSHATAAEPVMRLCTWIWRGGDLSCVVGRGVGEGARDPRRRGNSLKIPRRRCPLLHNEDCFTSAVRLRASHARNSPGFVKVSVHTCASVMSSVSVIVLFVLSSSSSPLPIRLLRRRFALLPRRPPILLPLFQICKVKSVHTINGGITTCAASLTQLQSRASHRRQVMKINVLKAPDMITWGAN